MIVNNLQEDLLKLRNGLNNTVVKGTLDDKFEKIYELRNEFTTKVNNLQGDVTKLRNDLINTPVVKSRSDIPDDISNSNDKIFKELENIKKVLTRDKRAQIYTENKVTRLRPNDSGGFRGGGGARGHGPGPRAVHAPKGPRTFTPPPPQCICQDVQKYSVRCLKVVPGVPKMVLIRSKSKKYPPISSKAVCKICPKVIPDGPKMA